MLTILIATALSAPALPAAAQDSDQGNSRSAQPTQQQRTRDGNGGERRICVNERVTGSRLMQRICLTAREWRDQQGFDDR